MEQNPGILLQIQSGYNQLTKAEKKVASYVMENTEQVLYMSITDLADACQVGDTSVYRFCRTMKLQGYQEFKMQLSLCMAAQDKIGAGMRGESESEELAERIMNLHMKSIKETYLLFDREAALKIVAMMEQAKRIFFFGIGDSLLMAEEARNKFLRVTSKVYCISDPHMQSMAAALMAEDDFIIVISYSGATKDNIHVVKEAKRAGARIACITHFRKSPLTAYADAVLLCGAKESPMDGGSMAVKMGQLFLIDMLYQEYYQNDMETYRKNREKTSKAV
ncbi:MAG: MurR/RpiR family transcriptional regulator, partial [Clostridiales bacterium]|nr:MurR/RpiR family transcriptional regulator [Clostridiales bacterium]